jgi:hypothetical protein
VVTERLTHLEIGPDGTVSFEVEAGGSIQAFRLIRHEEQGHAPSYDIAEARELFHERPWVSIAVRAVIRALEAGQTVSFPMDVPTDPAELSLFK